MILGFRVVKYLQARKKYLSLKYLLISKKTSILAQVVKKIDFGGIFIENETEYPLIVSNVKIKKLKTILY